MIKFGKIYKITNKINKKSYIGQTTRDIRIRINRHFQDTKHNNDDYVIHKAIRKYGIENFEISILEDNIPEELLDERERYWIAYYHTYIRDTKCRGYNMTTGGDCMLIDVLRKLSDTEINEIRSLLEKTNLTEQEIATRYHVSCYTISDINTGKSWHDITIPYPIRRQNVRNLSESEFRKTIEMLKTGLFSAIYIAEKIGINAPLISKINTGKYKKFTYPNNISFPIMSTKTVSNAKISVKNILLLINDYISHDITRKNLALKYKISESYVKSIVNLSNTKYYLADLKKPLKKYKKENLKKIQEKITLYERYE